MGDKSITEIRCSALPRIMACNASAASAEIIEDSSARKITIDTSGEVADIGTAAHEFYARMVRETLNEPGELFDLATRHGVDEDELRMLAWQGLREWKKLRDRIVVLGIEQELEFESGISISGHVDLSGRLKDDPETGIIIDWKTGYREGSHIAQIQGYALLDLLYSGDLAPSKYLMLVIWTRLGITETFQITASKLLDYREQIISVAKNVDRYSPSEANCRYCPNTLNCPARYALLKNASRDLQAIAGDSVGGEVAPESLAALYPHSRMLKKALDNYETMLRAAIMQNGGEVKFTGGSILMREAKRQSIAWSPSVLRAYLSEDQIADLETTLTVGKGALEKAVADNAGRGKKSEAKTACLTALKEAGAISEKVFQTIEYRED